MKIILILSILFSSSLINPVFGEDLKVVESQLNKNSIIGVLQNPYNYTIGAMTVRAEFYDKEDGHLVGLRDFGYVTEEELKPNEKSTFKIYEHAGETEEFPNTEFVVKAEGIDFSNAVDVWAEEQVKEIEDLGNALKGLPNEVITNIIEYENGTRVVTNVTEKYESNQTNWLLRVKIRKK